MTDIKCPICGERISGRNQEEMTLILGSHLAEVHNIRRSPEGFVGRGSPPGQMEREAATMSSRSPAMLTPEEATKREEVTRFYRPPLGSETITEREVETWSGREPTGENPESARLIQETNQWKYPRMETKEERVVGTWRSENRPGTSESYQQGRYASEELTPEEGMREERISGRSAQMSSVTHGGGMMHRMMNRRQMTMVMDCPICGRPVYGSDDDDLSDELRFHFKDIHNLRRT